MEYHKTRQSHVNGTTMGWFPRLTLVRLSPQVLDHMTVSEYLIHWKGYPNTENSWLPAKELTHAKELLAVFKRKNPSKEGI